jgi:hypothetical protein
MKAWPAVCATFLLLVPPAPQALAWRGGAVYHGPMGGVGVRGPMGGAAFRGPGGGAAAASSYYPPAYYQPPCGPPYTPSCP